MALKAKETIVPVVADTETFKYNGVGDKTGDKYPGEFKAKRRLSLRDHLDMDRMYQSLLGGDPSFASSVAVNIAALVSELSVRIIDAPKWWVESKGGLELQDGNVLGEIYEAAVNIEKKAVEETKKASEQAKEELRKEADKQP